MEEVAPNWLGRQDRLSHLLAEPIRQENATWGELKDLLSDPVVVADRLRLVVRREVMGTLEPHAPADPERPETELVKLMDDSTALAERLLVVLARRRSAARRAAVQA